MHKSVNARVGESLIWFANVKRVRVPPESTQNPARRAKTEVENWSRPRSGKMIRMWYGYEDGAEWVRCRCIYNPGTVEILFQTDLEN